MATIPGVPEEDMAELIKQLEAGGLNAQLVAQILKLGQAEDSKGIKPIVDEMRTTVRHLAWCQKSAAKVEEERADWPGVTG